MTEHIINSMAPGGEPMPQRAVSEALGPGALLIRGDRKAADFVLAPDGLESHGVERGARLDVVDSWRPDEVECPLCDRHLFRIWQVTHKPTGQDFVAFECTSCKQFAWAKLPEREP